MRNLLIDTMRACVMYFCPIHDQASQASSTITGTTTGTSKNIHTCVKRQEICLWSKKTRLGCFDQDWNLVFLENLLLCTNANFAKHFTLWNEDGRDTSWSKVVKNIRGMQWFVYSMVWWEHTAGLNLMCIKSWLAHAHVALSTTAALFFHKVTLSARFGTGT